LAGITVNNIDLRKFFVLLPDIGILVVILQESLVKNIIIH